MPWVTVKTQCEKIIALTVEIPRKVLIWLQKLSVNSMDLIFAYTCIKNYGMAQYRENNDTDTWGVEKSLYRDSNLGVYSQYFIFFVT
jgi:hypothetical protein